MNKKLLIGITFLSIFILIVTPIINAIEINEINDEIKKEIQENINSFHLNILDIIDLRLVNPFIKNLLLIIYIIGYFVMIPVGIVIYGHLDPDGHLDYKELIKILLECFLWPYILIDIIRAFLEDKNCYKLLAI